MDRAALLLMLLLPLPTPADTEQSPEMPGYGGDVFIAGDELIRLNPDRKTVLWRALPDMQSFTPAIADDLLLVGSSRGLYALDGNNGAVRWQLAADGVLYSPTVTKRYAYVAGRDGTLRAIGLANGHVLWQRRFTGWLYPPAVVGDLVIVSGSAARLSGINRHSGQTRWSIGLANEPVFRPVATASDSIVLTLFDGSVQSFDARSGEAQWRVEDNTASHSPVVNGDWIYLAGLDGVLRARSTSSGRLIWTRRLPAPASEPLVEDGVLVVTAADRVIALNVVNGDVLWRRKQPFKLAERPRISGSRLVLISRDYRVASWNLHGHPTTPYQAEE